MRQTNIKRITGETSVEITVNLDSFSKPRVNTPCGFLNHMLDLFGTHSKIQLSVTASGDIDVDYHHLVEDVGITLGDALLQALEDKKDINRYGHAVIPMDEARVAVTLDLSGRPWLESDSLNLDGKIGDFDGELILEFFRAITAQLKMNLHIEVEKGQNRHHIAEALFKGFARALRQAITLIPDSGIPSSKGVI